jgi:RecA-family ATPase
MPWILRALLGCHRGMQSAAPMTTIKPAKRSARGTQVEHLPLPSHSIEAEQSVLGGLMLDPAAWSKVSPLVKEESFFRQDHRLIFRAMADLQARGSAIDAVTVADSLEQRGELADVGGLAYIGTVARDTPSTANILTYATIVRDRAALRQLQAIGDDIVGSATNNATPAEIVADIQNRLRQLRLDSGDESMREPIDWHKLAGDPPPRLWFIPEWLGPWPMLTAGAGGAGKTRLWQTVATSLATGRRYIAEPPVPLNVLMWLCEDTQHETWRQQVMINAHFGLTMADLKERLHIVPRQGRDNTLLDLTFSKPTFTPLLEELRQQVNDLKIDVLVLDNVAQVFGANENDKHHTTVFVNGIAGVVLDRPFAPVFIGHTARSQSSEFSGSAAWENACRMRWYLGAKLPDQAPDEDEPVDPDTVYLAKRKANYASKDWLRLRFRNGLFVPEECEGGLPILQSFRDEAADRTVLAAFPRLVAMGLVPSDKAQAADYLPKQILSKGLAQNHSKKDLIAAMNRLMGAGKLRREKNAGQDSSRHPKPGLVMT